MHRTRREEHYRELFLEFNLLYLTFNKKFSNLRREILGKVVNTAFFASRKLLEVKVCQRNFWFFCNIFQEFHRKVFRTVRYEDSTLLQNCILRVNSNFLRKHFRKSFSLLFVFGFRVKNFRTFGVKILAYEFFFAKLWKLRFVCPEK